MLTPMRLPESAAGSLRHRRRLGPSERLHQVGWCRALKFLVVVAGPSAEPGWIQLDCVVAGTGFAEAEICPPPGRALFGRQRRVETRDLALEHNGQDAKGAPTP